MNRSYERYVYAGLLGKIIGVYMGRPVEGAMMPDILEKFGLIDHYVAPECGRSIVEPDDDISGTLTFVRALEDSGKLEHTPPDFYGDTWLNYLLERQTILWWGGFGMSTEHTAYLRLKEGYRAPESGSMELNGRKVAEQIGAQIFIDAFGLVAPGNPELAVRLARDAARVSHDGEAVYAAMVVAAMVSAAYSVRNMNQLLDLAVSFIPQDSLIAQVHRDVRAWAREDGNWQVTHRRIVESYGYQLYGGNCHVIPNHAIMVMAWAYAPDNFRDAQIIANTAGYDTDCNAGNVGAVMGAMLGLEGICQDYDFRTPVADRIILPTADGTSAVTDCWNEARRIISLGNRIRKGTSAPAEQAWMDFAAPGAVHGFQVLGQDETRASLSNPLGQALHVTARHLHLSPLRIATPVAPIQGPQASGYGIIDVSKLYPGMTVTMDLRGDSLLKTSPFLLVGTAGELKEVCCGTAVRGSGQVVLKVPETEGYPVLAVGLAFSAETDDELTADIRSVNACGPFAYRVGLLPQVEHVIPGWITHADGICGCFSDDPELVRRFLSNQDLCFVYTGTRWWHDVAIQARLCIHVADMAGIMASFQGVQRYVSVTRRGNRLVLALQHYGETILDEMALQWPFDQPRTLSLETRGRSAVAYLDGVPILRADDLPLCGGGAGFLLKRGNLGVGRVSIEGQATPVL